MSAQRLTIPRRAAGGRRERLGGPVGRPFSRAARVHGRVWPAHLPRGRATGETLDTSMVVADGLAWAPQLRPREMLLRLFLFLVVDVTNEYVTAQVVQVHLQCARVAFAHTRAPRVAGTAPTEVGVHGRTVCRPPSPPQLGPSSNPSAARRSGTLSPLPPKGVCAAIRSMRGYASWARSKVRFGHASLAKSSPRQASTSREHHRTASSERHADTWPWIKGLNSSLL
jgi:hypothetical protein